MLGRFYTFIVIFLIISGSKILSYSPNSKYFKFSKCFLFLRRRPKNPHLLAFHDNSEFSKMMVPVVKKVMDETGLHIEVIEVNTRKNMILFQKVMELTKENGIPLYYNMRTGYYIVGMTTYENLKDWSLDQKPEKFSRMNLDIFEDASYRITVNFVKLLIFRVFVAESADFSEKSITKRGEENILKKYKETVDTSDKK